ncbi:MAG TPA: response regulator transcription factor [Verrucomicrobiae bacterium]|jgi:DNA-binding NarL/FixJ family response regulator|nr:response regulator transcription factor [Verrucomicrobiae bacterium]
MKKPGKIRILVVDDHYIVRMGLIALVNSEPDMEVVAEADDGAQALQQFAQHQPDLVLLDSRMPVKNGIHTAAEMRARHPAVRILMLSAFGGSEDIHRAVQAGAQGYVLKSSSGENLIPALRAVAAGQKWMPKDVTALLASRKLSEELTARELEVLNHLARGRSNKEIAEALGISEYTVKDHLKHILGKLHVADRTEAVTTALQRGIIHL